MIKVDNISFLFFLHSPKQAATLFWQDWGMCLENLRVGLGDIVEVSETCLGGLSGALGRKVV